MMTLLDRHLLALPGTTLNTALVFYQSITGLRHSARGGVSLQYAEHLS